MSRQGHLAVQLGYLKVFLIRGPLQLGALLLKPRDLVLQPLDLLVLGLGYYLVLGFGP